MRRLLLLLIACLVTGLAAGGHPDFSGHWIVDLDRSKFGKMQKPNGMTLHATASGDTLHAVQTMETPGGPVTTESNWIPDGQEHDVPGANGGKMVAKWEGDTLYSERRSSDGMFEERIWLSLSKDGKTATEKVWTKGPDGTDIRTLVWQKP